jgi:serine/threonine protein kinase
MDAPKGLCPRCLMALNLCADTGIPDEAGETETATLKSVPEEPQPIGEIARLFPQLEILKHLGRGGMGFVYLARQPRLERMVALKVLARARETDPHFAGRFSREARALARLNHPNIVAVYDFGDVQGHYYLLIEYVDGMNLRQLMQSKRITPEEAMAIVPKICGALQYAHEQGVVHRDIKPENILVDRYGQVKIADFGIAKLLDPARTEFRLTEERQVIGTPHYMAPEQIESPQRVDHRADIYSLGVVFYEVLTGELPLGKFAPPSRKAAIDARLDEVVLRALEKEPEERYQQASELRLDVETIAGETLGPAPAIYPNRGPKSPVGRWSSIKSWRWPAAVGTVLSLAALAFVFRDQLPFWRRDLELVHGAGDVVFPADAGVVDVTKPPYNAKADGRTDSTAAIQMALKDFRASHAIIYLPKGTFLISDTLRWGEGLNDSSGYRRLSLQGQSGKDTVIKLKDSCTGFGDPRPPSR